MEALPKNLSCVDNWLKTPSYENSLEDEIKKSIEEGKKELDYLETTPFMIPACMGSKFPIRPKDDELCVNMKFDYIQSKKDDGIWKKGLCCSGDKIFGIRAYLADTPVCSSPTDNINVQIRYCWGTAIDKLPLEMEGSSSRGSEARIIPQSGGSLFSKWQIIREEFATEAKYQSEFAQRFAKKLLFMSVPEEAVPKAIQELFSVLDAAITPDWQPHLAHLDIYVLTMIDPDFDSEPPAISADFEKYALWDD